MQIIIAGAPVAYSDEGKGPVLLFIHGWRDSKETWREVIDRLKPRYRCVSLDLPNFGASHQNDNVTTLEEYSDALYDFTEKLSLDSYVYIGHSMGGQIGIFAVGTKKMSPQKMILIASAGVRDEGSKRRTALRMLSKPLRRIIPERVKSRAYRAIGSDYDAALNTTLKKTIDQMLSRDIQHEASRIQIPTLLIYGEHDMDTPVRFGKKLHSCISGSEFVEIKDSDHFVHHTQSDKIANIIGEFCV